MIDITDKLHWAYGKPSDTLDVGINSSGEKQRLSSKAPLQQKRF
jgi:phenylalanyl-tRNA synthetase beta subunit